APPALDGLPDGLFSTALKLLEADIPVLILGETGTGKDRLARALHASGSRSGAPFAAVNCAAIPEGLIEAELFGYQPGAYTGASRQ
ncbi:sigma 54-interacting transcriptional regulator, partial [Pseudogulbenkiania ferrooxidans]|uniref:sigma 54-interacting transcriptional regulator n=1 Tax=Pseudogulbenkiania ferrooxidans TaxID=549169 RepID=UPI0005B79245